MNPARQLEVNRRNLLETTKPLHCELCWTLLVFVSFPGARGYVFAEYGPFVN